MSDQRGPKFDDERRTGVEAVLRASPGDVVGIRTAAAADWGVHIPEQSHPVVHTVLRGELLAEFPGRKAHRLGPGDLVWVPPGASHRLVSLTGGFVRSCDELAARRSARTGSRLRPGHGEQEMEMLTLQCAHDPRHIALLGLAITEPLRISAEDGQPVLPIVAALDDEYRQRATGANVVAAGLVGAILAYIYRVAEREGVSDFSSESSAAFHDSLLQKALAVLDRHPPRSWSTDMLAAELRVSRSTLHRRFATAIGQAPAEYLMARRMLLAARRLRDSEDSVERVATYAGYGSSQAFSRAFRRIHDQSPTAYRRSLRGEARDPASPIDRFDAQAPQQTQSGAGLRRPIGQ